MKNKIGVPATEIASTKEHPCGNHSSSVAPGAIARDNVPDAATAVDPDGVKTNVAELVTSVLVISTTLPGAATRAKGAVVAAHVYLSELPVR